MDLGAVAYLDLSGNCFVSIDHPGPGDLLREQMKQLSTPAQRVLEAAMQYEINPECYSREIATTTLRTMALHCRRDALLLLSVADELESN